MSNFRAIFRRSVFLTAAFAVTVWSAAPSAQSGPQVLTAEILQTDLSKHVYSSPVPPTQCNYDGIDCSPSLRSGHYASAVGPNGNVAGNTGLGAFWWTKATGLVEIPETFGTFQLNQGGFAKGVNGKGQVVGVYYPHAPNGGGSRPSDQIGEAVWGGDTWNERAYLWSQADGFVDLGALGQPVPCGTDIGCEPFRYLRSAALGINEYGQVVGWAEVPLYDTDGSISGLPGNPISPFRQKHAFLWQPTSPNAKTGTMIDLGRLGGPYNRQSEGSRALAINDAGVISGYSATTISLSQEGGARHAFLWTPTTPNGTTGTMQDIAPAPGKDYSLIDDSWYFGNRINNAGQTVGWSASYSQYGHTAFIASASGVTHFEAFPPGVETHPWGVSPNGTVVGRAFEADGDYSNYKYTAFKRAPDGTITNLGKLPGAQQSIATGVDDSGLITGTSYNMNNGDYAHATAWQNGGIVDLQQAGWNWSEVYGQNQEGMAAGYRYAGDTRAVVWTFDGAGSGGGGSSDTTSPVISGVPADISVAATSASGASVTYTAPTANDAVSGSVAVVCAPTSGSMFPVGTTAVACTASDAALNAATASFSVTVAPYAPPQKTIAQLFAELIAMVNNVGPGKSLPAKSQVAQQSYLKGNNASAANQLSALLNEVKAQADKKVTAAQAAQITALTNQIITRLGA